LFVITRKRRLKSTFKPGFVITVVALVYVLFADESVPKLQTQHSNQSEEKRENLARKVREKKTEKKMVRMTKKATKEAMEMMSTILNQEEERDVKG